MLDMEQLHIVSVAEAKKLISGIKGKKSFGLMVRAFLPTTDDPEPLGFEGAAFVKVSYAVFLEALETMLAKPFETKGARLRLRISPPRSEGLSTYIYCY